MPSKKPNPNRIRRQPTPDSPPPPDQGKRRSPDDEPDWVAVGHEEAGEVGVTHGAHAGGRRSPRQRGDAGA